MIDRSIRSGNKTVDGYLEALEAELVSFNGSKVKLLIRSIDNMAGKLAKDLDMISAEQKLPNGDEVELSNKLVDTFLKMVKDADKIKSFSDMINTVPVESKSMTVVGAEENKVVTLKNGLDPNKNIFEQVQALNKKNGKNS